MTEDSVVVSSLTSVVNVAQLMRRKDMGVVLVVADDRLRGLVADRERHVHRARYRPRATSALPGQTSAR
ncbi:CBS domain-containing protein [Streptomyces sp. NBC_01717]|uniref:CBS domain-containing protein n=1 Tax=Streptomyces sp. NBC_01717 TaxID=2975918 RepID=UPI003FCE6675